MQSVNDIRQTFLDYFSSYSHEIVSSSSLVPLNDPTLMFANSGMVQFKNVFTGVEEKKFKRAVTSQKCVRAGGKHNDLENVGYTARHHTFFEMLGNFSFGDYFKEYAIELAWNLVTKEFLLDRAKLLVTVHSSDEEAAVLWKKIAGLSDKSIIRISTSDNFWAMGDTGPCGPCSEIFFDHGEHIFGGPPGSKTEHGDRFIEIWNLVFMQFEQLTNETRVDLPQPSIDTGMGLERIAAVLQGTHDNYEIDMMRSLINAISEVSNVPSEGKYKTSQRVIADHLRASSFLIADGVLPSNEGRGYVLRRIMRRAMRHAHLMGCKDPLIWRLVPQLISEMGKAFPEINRGEALITETLKSEEERFKNTLDNGLKILDNATAELSKGDQLDGSIAFKLYDTYGFPLDLTQDVLRGRGVAVDEEGFEKAMQHQKKEARSAWVGSGSSAEEIVWFEVREKIGATDFLGYGVEEISAKVMSILKDGEVVDSLKTGEKGLLLFNQTPFYAESGGQLGDHGTISSEKGVIADVSDTQKKASNLYAHSTHVEKGSIKLGENVSLKIDINRRCSLKANHSATHLLHASLRGFLGEHVTQKGSLVAHDRLRFDFSHPKPLTEGDLRYIETTVNQQIRANSVVTTRLMDPDSAVESGALALFGERYGDEVRVVSMGADADRAFSTELCGGTHVDNTGEIGVFKIINEVGVSAGVRRIEALTGWSAEECFSQLESNLYKVAAILKSKVVDVPERVSSILDERRILEKKVAASRRMVASGNRESENKIDVNGISFVSRLLDDVPSKELKNIVDSLKIKFGKDELGVAAVASVSEGKANIVVGITQNLAERVSAVDLVNSGSRAVGGKGGGGRSDLAQAGGPLGGKAQEALDVIRETLRSVK